jgi:hypothetical protein
VFSDLWCVYHTIDVLANQWQNSTVAAKALCFAGAIGRRTATDHPFEERAMNHMAAVVHL